jgi:RimJ/RimL family protein N-acetyltransferase
MPWAAAEPVSPQDRRAMLEAWSTAHEQGRSATFACLLGTELLGSCGFHRERPDPAGLEIGYWLAAAQTGRGYATELSLLLAEEAFAHEEIEHVEIYCHPANEASAAVARRAGFEPMGLEPAGGRAAGERSLRHRLERASFDPSWRSRFSASADLHVAVALDAVDRERSVLEVARASEGDRSTKDGVVELDAPDGR